MRPNPSLNADVPMRGFTTQWAAGQLISLGIFPDDWRYA